jgi:hypothetical protein
MHLDFAVAADYALVDQAGKISVLGIFQHIWVQQFPAMHPRLHLVLRLKGKRTEIGEHAVQIRLLDEQDQEILGGNGQVTFAEPPAGVTDIEAAAILVFDVPFPHPGQYRFEITIDGAPAAAVPISVSQMPASQGGQHESTLQCSGDPLLRRRPARRANPGAAGLSRSVVTAARGQRRRRALALRDRRRPGGAAPRPVRAGLRGVGLLPVRNGVLSSRSAAAPPRDAGERGRHG